MRFANKLIRTAVIAAILCAGIPEIPGHTASAYAGTADIADEMENAGD